MDEHTPEATLDTEKLGQAVDELTRRAQPAAAPPGDGLPSSDLAAVLPRANGGEAYVVDEAAARASPCTEFDLGEGQTLTFAEGLVGALNEGQQALYCAETIKKPLTPEQQATARQFKEAGDACGLQVAELPHEERINPWVKCMANEAKQRGVTL